MEGVKLINIVKKYGEKKVIDNISLNVEGGEYLCILGSSGAGKTTIMKIICGLIVPDEGKVMVGNKDITNKKTEDRGITFLYQNYSLFPNMNVYENIIYSQKAKGFDEPPNKKFILKLLETVNMKDKKEEYPKNLSGGMQQRIALVRALASGAKILLLDEPLRSLDPKMRSKLRKELRNLTKKMKITTIHVTHDQEEALEIADKIIIMDKGKVMQIGSPFEIFRFPLNAYVADFMDRVNFIEVKIKNRIDNIAIVETISGIELEVVDNYFPVGEEVIYCVKISDISVNKLDGGFLKGIIERIIYEGVRSILEVYIEMIGMFYISITTIKSRDFEEKELVYLKWSVLSAKVFDKKSFFIKRSKKWGEE